MEKLNPTIKPIDRIAPYEQKYEASCGPASLSIALRALGHSNTEERIMREGEMSMTGVEWEDMLKYVSDKMFYPLVYRTRATYEDLLEEHQDIGYPIFVCWKTDRTLREGGNFAGSFKAEPGPHFSVVKYMTKDEIYIADPSFGDIFKMTREDFLD